MASHVFPGAGEIAVRGSPGREKYLILADDLTGAADSAVALAGPGQEAEVFLDPALAFGAAARVVAIDLNTRGMGAAAAATAVQHATAQLGQGSVLFKKIDSTLRGHIGAELAALCRSLPCGAPMEAGLPPLCIVAPAHPALGRTMEGGALHMHGVPISAAAPWGDAHSGNGATIAEGLRAHGFVCTPLALSDIRQASAQELSALIERASSAACAALICDAQSMDDMHRIVAAAAGARVRCIWVGSGGLAQALADVRPPPDIDAASAADTRGAAPPRSRAFVVGSFSSIADAQVRELARQDNVRHMALPVDEITGALSAGNALRINEILTAGQDLLLSIDAGGRVRPELSEALARGMAKIAARLLPRLDALVCCGGDTSRALFNHIGANHLRVRRSSEIGSTHARATLLPDLPIIVKAGAFGDAQVLVRLHHELSRHAADRDGNTAS